MLQRHVFVAVKLRGAGPDDVAALREQLVSVRAQHATRLDAYRDMAKQQFPDPTALTGAALHQHLVLRGGIRTEQGSVEWLDEVLTALGDQP